MSEFPQNRRCFSVAEEEVAAAAQRFCLGKEPHDEDEMLVVVVVVVVVVGPRIDAHARSTIALLIRVILLRLSNVSNVS
jgi:hypothetical protein